MILSGILWLIMCIELAVIVCLALQLKDANKEERKAREKLLEVHNETLIHQAMLSRVQKKALDTHSKDVLEELKRNRANITVLTSSKDA